MPNGPATDSLTIRHTPGTVPGGARPGWGLPYEQLPSALTPESMLEERIQTGKQQIQDKYALQWREVSRSARFIGPAKTNRMLQQIDAAAKQEMLQFNQQAQQQFTQLQNIDRLAQQGAITNPDEIKSRMMFGADVARQMYPRPEKGQAVQQAMGELDRYGKIVQAELNRFRSVRIPKLFKWEAQEKRKMQILDLSLPTKKKDEIGAWRDATKEELQIRDFYLQEQKEIRSREAELVAVPGISHRVIQPGTIGGTFSDKVVESYKEPVKRQPIRRQQPTITKPKVIRQRSKLTGQIRESYDGGRTWQIVSG